MEAFTLEFNNCSTTPTDPEVALIIKVMEVPDEVQAVLLCLGVAEFCHLAHYTLCIHVRHANLW